MKKTLTTLIGTIALISSAAFAQTSGTGSGTGTTGNTTGSSDSGVTSGSSRSGSGSDSMGSGSSQSQSQQDSSSVSPQGFSSLDKDSSGEISRREAASQQSLSRIFDRADENKDGQLSQSEYQQALEPESSSVN